MDLFRVRPVSIVGAMKTYGQFCPVAKACEIVAERWTPLVLRELLCGSTRFSELQRGVPLMSRTLLAQRLRELEDAGVVASAPRARGRGREYRLTPAGEEVRSVIMGLGEWGQRWARRQIAPDDLDAELLAWDMHRRLNVDRLPAQRVVMRFDLRRVPRHQPGRRTWWLVLTRPEVDLCLKDPGFEVDLTLDADLAALTRVWMGDMPLQDALRAELIRPDGPRDLVRAFPSWFGLSLFAGVERPAVVSPPRVPDRGRLGRAARPHHREAPRPHSARQR
jgi:DNA-binding HxlR family transcriptional regulator